MDSDMEEFASFSSKKLSQISPSQKSKNNSRLSFSHQKKQRNIKNGQTDAHTNIKKVNQPVTSDCERVEIKSDYFCPLCQVPFKSLNIQPHIHVNGCNVAWDDLKECPEGKDCSATNFFHFKDFSHRLLANFRASEKHSDAVLPHDPVAGSSKINQSNSPRVRRKVVRKIIIPETSTDSSPEFISNSSKKIKLGVTDGNTHKKSSNVTSSLSSDSTFFDIADKKNIYESKNKLYDTYVSSQHSEGTSHLENKRKGACVNEKNKGLDSEESSVSISLLKSLDDEIIIKKPFRPKQPSQLLVNVECEQTAVSCIQLKGNQFQNDICASKHQVSSEAEISYNKTDNCEIGSDEISDFMKGSDFSVELPIKNKLNFKGNIEFKEKVNSEDRKEMPANSVKANVIPCECEPGSSTAIPTVELEVTSPKKNIQSPVKVLLRYNSYGWQTLGIDTVRDAAVEEVNVAVCNCRSTLHVCCTVANATKKQNAEPGTKQLSLESKFSTSLQDLGFPTDKMCESTTKELSVVSDVSTTGKCSTAFSFSEKIISDQTVQKKKSTTEDWKKLMARLKNKGYTDMNVLSSESQSSNSEASFVKKGTSYESSQRKCPFYKKIPDTTFVVDAFQYGIIPGVTSYFLTHFHSDHYIGLRKGFNKPIFCSAVTAALVKKKIGVDEKYLHILELEEQRAIGSVRITALDANHCPGSIMLLFQLPDGRNILHVGDFRFNTSMQLFPSLRQCHIDQLFLDTTYCDPQYDFPTQEEVISKVVHITKSTLQQNPKTLIACGTYLIGKEKVFMGICKAIGAKIWARPDKRSILKCLCDKDIENNLVTKPFEAQVHVLAMKDINHDDLQKHLASLNGIYSNVLAFRPSGWELQQAGSCLNFKQNTSINTVIYGVPYSEHSSYSELQKFVQFIRPDKIVPTVNVGKNSIFQRYFSSWFSSSLSSKTQAKVSSFLFAK